MSPKTGTLILLFLGSLLFRESVLYANDAPQIHEIKTEGMKVLLNSNGEIINLAAHGKPWPLSGKTVLADCEPVGETIYKQIGKSFSFTRKVADHQGHTATVCDHFSPTKNSIRWEIEIISEDKPWSTPIETILHDASTEETRFWAAWSEPHWVKVWRDPLVLCPLTNRIWSYSFLPPDIHCTNLISLPLMTLAEPDLDRGLSLVLSPEDINPDLHLETTTNGIVTFTRSKLRLGGGKVFHFAMDLTVHEADWRGGLRWLVGRYPQFFDPPNPMADEMAGCGAYSGDENPVDVARLKKMAFRINWKFGDDFPYMGMFIPAVTNADERWQRACAEAAPTNKPDTTSCRQLNDYAHYMKTNGFYLLNYFNVTEFGRNMEKPATRKADDPELWKDPRAYLENKLPGAILISGAATYCNGSVVDPGDPAYQDFILEQASRNDRLIPDAAGICIDRLDWLNHYNEKADDGVSWVDGKPARSLHISWQSLMDRLGPLMHKDGKVIFVNAYFARLDWLRHVDGVYNEFGNMAVFNTTALVCLRKPALAWSYNETIHEPNPDAFMQRHLYLGCFPTAPYQWNNHCMNPEKEADQLFLDYGPLLDAMRGKKWVLEPHCVATTTPGVKVNLFEVDAGYAIPVTFGGSNNVASVQIQNLPQLNKMQGYAILPGVEQRQLIHFHTKDGRLELEVPLKRGCAMVVFTSEKHAHDPATAATTQLRQN